MATPTDPAFGAGFDAAAFRSAIESTMQMGMPTNTDEAVTFYFKPYRNYAIKDVAGNPYDWTATPTNDTSVDRDPVQVPVAVEFVARASLSEGTPFGEIDTPKLVLTLLDEHYEQVRGADWVEVDGSKYDIDYTAPPVGLFNVTVYTIYASAIDEK